MNNVIWARNWESFGNNSTGGATYMSITDDTLTIDNRISSTTSAYKYYTFPCDELSEVNVFVEVKLVEGTSFIGVDFFNASGGAIVNQSKTITGSTFCPTSFKAISPKGTKYCRVTFGTWNKNSTVAMYKIPQVYVSKGEGMPSMCSALIKFAGSTKEFSIITDMPSVGITGVSWDTSNKCVNINLDGSCTKNPNIFVVPMASSHNMDYWFIGENYPRNKNRVQVYCKKLSDGSTVDMQTVSNTLFFNVLVLR